MNTIIRTLFSFSFLVLVSVGQAKPYPAGIISLFGADMIDNPLGDLTNKTAWTNPLIDGVRMRSGWNVVEPQKGTYNWAEIDQALSLATEHGKRVGFSVAAGTTTPQWVYDAGAIKYALQDGSGTFMPVPWDVAFQSQWLPFIQAMGARYDGNPALAYVCPTGFMQVCVMYLSKTTADDASLTSLSVQAGYSDLKSAYEPAAEKIITAFMNAFPTTPVILSPSIPFLTEGMAAQDDVRNWGFDTYPGRFGVIYTSLRATPAPHLPSPGPLSYPKGFQMIGLATDTAELYGNPEPPYNPLPPTPLDDALKNAIYLQGQFVEVYGNDLNDSANQTVLPADGAGLKKNVPLAPPTNLHVD